MTFGALAGTYIIVQLWANTMGLIVIFVLDGIIEEALRNRGYERLPITTSDKIKDFTMGVVKFNVPMYYCIKSINLVSNNLNSIINERLKAGQYIMTVESVKPKIEVPREIIKEIPKIEPLPMVQEYYKATSNKGSVYDSKPMPKLEFIGELERPELDKIIPFAPRTSKKVSSLDEANTYNQVENKVSAYNNSNVYNLDEARKAHSYIFDKKDVQEYKNVG